MPVKPIASFSEFQDIIESDKPIAIDFYTPYHQPCKEISSVFEEYSKEIPGLDFYTVDIIAQERIANYVGIQVTPTFGVFKKGMKVGNMMGVDHTALKDFLTQGKKW